MLHCLAAGTSLVLFLLASTGCQPASSRNTIDHRANTANLGTANLGTANLGFQRGITFTSEGRQSSYRSLEAHDMLRKLPEFGVDAIALVPYGSIMRDSKQLRFGGWERDDSLVALSKTAHGLGMRVMLKPQVWIRGSYPGDFDLPDKAERERWFADYRQFTLHYARLATEANVDLFCIGTEFAKLTPHEQFWRDLIAEVRTVYLGPLTYAANWGPEFETLPFWDALDYIGLNNYYPIPDSFDLSDQVAKVARVQARWNMPLLFTETGSASHHDGHQKPWTDRQGEADLESQSRAYEALLAAYWDKPWFYGAYWWKVGSNGFGGPQDRTHTPWNKPAMDVLRRWYLKPATRP